MSHKSRPAPRSDSGSDGFTCIQCQREVPGAIQGWGTKHRNHCPFCLWSRHLDEQPGDRRAACRAPMQPIAIEVRPDGEWAILHRCAGCNTLRANRLAGDDSELALLALALRPLARPAFPLDLLGGG